MAVWTLMPVYKKSIQEVEFWTKDGKVIQYSVWWRGGSVTLTTATDAAPEIDLDNDDIDGLDVYGLVDGEHILDVEMDGFWDGDSSEWLATSPGVTEEELQEVFMKFIKFIRKCGAKFPEELDQIEKEFNK